MDAFSLGGLTVPSCVTIISCWACNCIHDSVSSITLKGDEGEILLDYSKNIVTKETMKLLFNLVCALLLN